MAKIADSWLTTERVKSLLLGFVASVVIVASATVEDWYGRFDYSAEAPGYLDSAQAIMRGDWSVALTPQWSIGYPLMLAATRWMFPTGPEGEWIAIHVVNLVVFLITYLSFLYFLKVASIYTARVNGAEAAALEPSRQGFILIIGTSIFLLWQLIIGDVSRISPDLSISCVFFLVTATCLNFFMRPSVKTAAIMGFLMGLGYVVKVGFLPTSFLMLLVVWFHGLLRSPGQRLKMTGQLACALPVMVLLAAPYATALSKVYGSFTLGESGKINYAWSVNQLPQLCNWQGGPSPFGAPIHPTNLVWKNPPVFTFGETFPVTYPPYYNISYYYDGYRHFFSLRNELAAVKQNVSVFRRFFTGGYHTGQWALAEGMLVAVALFLLKQRLVWGRRLIALWPLFLLGACPIGMYILVHIEPRYVIGPLIAILIIPFLPLFLPTALISNRASSALAILIALGCAGLTVVDKREVLGPIYAHQTNVDDPAWKAGIFLQRMGIRPGDKVAAVGTGSCLWDTWAMVCGAHIVAEVGNFAYDPSDQDKDLKLFTENPQVQRTVFDLFRRAGAVVVVARSLPEAPPEDGWVLVPGTWFWVHRL